MEISPTGRFDRSFAIRMIREFSIVLVAITLFEVLVRFGIGLYMFEHQDGEATRVAAERLASDLKDIMLNQGGPVAARTIYPTWQRNFKDLGLEIALLPSHETVTSIQKTFAFEPKGISAVWPEGRHHEAVVELRAEPFCLGCHVDAQPGDVLGQVVVRNYLSVRMRHWWEEAGVITIVGMAKVILNTLVLFLMLRARMEPLLALRSTITSLAAGKLDLSYRALVKSDDEFGALAQDLNHFLDRMAHVFEDLNHVLTRMITVKHRVDQVSAQLTEHFDTIHDQTQRAVKLAFEEQKGRAVLSRETLEIVELVLSSLQLMDEHESVPAEYKARVRQIMQRFSETLNLTQDPGNESTAEVLLDLSKNVHASSHFLESMALLEERMEVIAESGQTLLARLSGHDAAAAQTEASPSETNLDEG